MSTADAEAARAEALAPAEQLGQFLLIEEVGYGGMGSVWVAKREGPGGFQKFVALKTIHPHLAKEPDFVAMFLDEARIAAAMQHPNVAQVFELGQARGHFFLAMEYLAGEHLGQVRHRAGALDPTLAAHLVRLAALGLNHAHEATGEDGRPLHLVHRDVSPQNIFVTYSGEVKVTDFGIARAEGRIAKKTETGHIKGKCAYMAPEQVYAKPLDRRTDVFALGAILWELLAGKPLFDHPTDTEVLMAIANDPIVAPPGTHPALAAIVLRALAKDPDDRHPTAGQLARDLNDWIQTHGGRIDASSEARSLMRSLFAAEQVRKAAVLRDPAGSSSSSARASGVASVTTPEAMEPTQLATPSPESDAVPAVSSEPGSVRAEPGSTRGEPGSTRGWIALGATLLLLAGGAAWALSGSDEPPDPTSPTAETQGSANARIESVPSGAEVWVDGRMVGSTPALVRDLPSGRHALELRLRGHEATRVSFDVESERIELQYRLSETPEPTETSEPTEAPDTTETERAHAPPDMRTPRMQTPPMQTPQMQSTMQTADTTTAEVERSMQSTAAAPARLSVFGRPWGTVRINGGPARRTPLYDASVPSGRVHLEFRAEGTGPPESQTLQLAPGGRGRATFPND
jgi:serine/threonine-protein kinase